MSRSFQQWLDSLGVEAQKVEIRARRALREQQELYDETVSRSAAERAGSESGSGTYNDDSFSTNQYYESSMEERGLFASQDIFAGERIIYLPSTALLTEEWIQTQGRRTLQRKIMANKKRNKERLGNCDEDSGNLDTLDYYTSLRDKERLVVGVIEELRQLIIDEAGTSVVRVVSRSLDYKWRPDDAVTLYLMAARRMFRPECDRSVHDGLSSLAPAAQEMTEQSGEPILVSNVVPVSSDFCDSEYDSNQKLGERAGKEREELSSFSFLSYVAEMPKGFPTSPLYYTEHTLDYMQGTNCFEFTKRMLSQMEMDWTRLGCILRAYFTMDDRQVKFPEGEPWDPDEDFEHYKWALCSIYSRSTDFCVHQGHRRVMAPLFDMMNHDFNSNVTHEMDAMGNMAVFAGSNVPAGSEIYLNYGNFSNEKLLLVYGFAVPSNPYDAVQIYAPIPNEDSLLETKAAILKRKFGIVDPNAPHFLRLNDQSPIIPESLFCVLRLIGLLSQEDMSTASEVTFGSFEGMIGIENEYGALMALQHALYTMARQLALRLISDESLHAASTSARRGTATAISNGMTDGGNHMDVKHYLSDEEERDETIKGHAIIFETNIAHCKALCQSEYTILQGALQEISSRMELLQEPANTLLPQ